MSLPIWQQSIEEVGRSLRSGEVGLVELTELMLRRIGELDPKLGAYETLCAEAALEDARRLADELADGRDRGALHGIPIGMKDLCDTAGLRTAAGTRVMDARVPDSDATVVARLRDAGCVLLGKLKMTEGAFSTHHPDVTPPRNPWDLERWSGVSSSGSGVATAAGLCFASLGSDTGGSIRFPSAANGIVGIKPTWGRVSRAGVFPLADSLDHVGPMTRNVRDAALVLQAIAGPDERDPTTLDSSVPDLLAGIEDGPGGVRIGIDPDWNERGMDADVVARVAEAGAALQGEGACLRTIAMPPTDALALGWGVTCAAEVAIAHEEFYPSQAEAYGPALKGVIDAGLGLDGLAYARVHLARLEFNARLASVFEQVDLVLCPAIGNRLGGVDGLGSDAPLDALERLMRFTAPFDFSGSPTVTLPCGQSGDGMPVGMQLVGRHGEEDLLCRVARSYEGLASTPSLGWPVLA